jgi:excisionase family DNA binding protein
LESAEVAVSIAGLEALIEQIVEQKLRERDNDGYLNATQAAEFLGLTPQALYARVGRGQVPYKRNGRRVFFKRSELRAYIEDPLSEA